MKAVIKYLGASDCDMEKGSLRCDANISIRPEGEKKLGAKVELKNMNSFKAVREALNYEISRQTAAASAGERIVQETRLWDEPAGVTVSMRSKELAHDYRYFPEPDLVPVELDEKYIGEIRKGLCELPAARKRRFVDSFGLSEYDSDVLVSERELADYFEEVLRFAEEPKTASNWITNELLGKLNAENKNIKDTRVSAKMLAELIKFITGGTISGKIAKVVFEQMYSTGKSAGEIVKEQGLVQISDEKEIEKFVDEALAENSRAADEYRNGKQQAIGSLVGAVMKKTKGKANPKIVNEILKRKLG